MAFERRAESMLFFSLLVVVIFVFSFDPLAEESRHIVGGLVWVAFLFAAVVALNQTWARELRNQVLDAYRVSPAPANALFLAKVVGNFIFVSVLEALMTPLFVIFYNLHVLGPAWQLIPTRAAGNLGAGREWDILCGDVIANAQPRNHAAAAAFSDFDPCGAGDGCRHNGCAYRRRLGAFLHRVASDLRCGVYYSLSGTFRNDSPRRMKRLFPILSILTAVFLAYATVPRTWVAPTDALQGTSTASSTITCRRHGRRSCCSSSTSWRRFSTW